MSAVRRWYRIRLRRATLLMLEQFAGAALLAFGLGFLLVMGLLGGKAAFAVAGAVGVCQ